MKFQTLKVVRHKLAAVWPAMRDDLPLVTSNRQDIHSVAEQDRQVVLPVHRIVNIWRAKTRLPAAITKLLDEDMFAWTDRAEWDDETGICKWSIELHHFRDAIHCDGTTVFESAIGGNGTKITFSGKLEWSKEKLGGIAGGITNAVLSNAEGIVRNAIQKNFLAIVGAVEDHLDALKKK